jgi:transposase
VSVCELLRKLAARPSRVPITVVLDNARYQRCALVQSTEKALNIELLFLPTYSPNLNLIERLWKFTKKKVLYSKYYATFADFQNAISSLLDNAHRTHREELDSLLTLKFQTFRNLS